jgi:hypothetical protein
MSFFKGYGKGKGDTIVRLDPTKLAASSTPPTDTTKLWIDTSK